MKEAMIVMMVMMVLVSTMVAPFNNSQFYYRAIFTMMIAWICIGPCVTVMNDCTSNQPANYSSCNPPATGIGIINCCVSKNE